jgi:hypothetical protein
VKTLFLAWQAPDVRQWFPVGRLEADVEHSNYIFQYTRGAIDAQRGGFHPIASFPRLKDRYQSEELFPMFKNRILGQQRKDFADYLQSLDLERNDPIEILSITGGERQTDSFEVFPKIERQPDNSFHCRFFLHGLRHMTDAAQARSMTLRAGELLGVSVELTNPKTGLAIQLTSEDYAFVGWTPRYLVGDLLQAIAQTQRISARVVRVNAHDVPANRRVLVELGGVLPEGFEPMASELFLPITDLELRH